ncbi:MAG TPA: protein phosphatase 2C domain-containing protein, partial [Isosphaeraceae bacterium]|nr:protein phosphatase 2C domain-containing protein [Isosphaeraceae bacterium]
DSSDLDTADFPISPLSIPPLVESQALRARVAFGAVSNRGKVRVNNEDHFFVGRIHRGVEMYHSNMPDDIVPRQVEEEGFVMVVADGMGGAASGEHASMLAILTGLRVVLNTNKWNMAYTEEETCQLIQKMQAYFNEMDQVLLDQARLHPEMAGMGTTLIVTYSVGNVLFVVHAGDSRGYLIRGKHIEQLTKDHTLAQMLAETGQIPPEEVSRHKKRHVLTNFLGGPTRGVVADIQRFLLSDNDRILLCSDGLSELVPVEEIARIVQDSSDPQSACDALVAQALDKGGSDNITVTLGHYRFEDQPGG